MKARVLFLCTGNSYRSQMAEGWARHLQADGLEAASAGIEADGLNPRAVAVMAEAGVDISSHRSQSLDQLVNQMTDLHFDLVVTVGDNAAQNCPVCPGRARMLHQPFDDPPRLAADTATEEEALAPYRRVRDEIRVFVETLPESLAP